MNIYKKLTAVCLAMLMLLSVAPAECLAAAEETVNTFETAENTDEENSLITVDGIKYQLSDEEAYIVGAEDLSGNIEFPSEVEGVPVTKICRKAFESNKEITGVVIPETVTEIEDYAFIACSNLDYIRILGSRVNLGFQVFNDTAAYLAQKKSNEPTYLDGYLLNCDTLDYSVKEITVKTGTRGIAKQALNYVTNLRKVRFPMSNCHIYDSEETFNRNIIIYGNPGSTAEEYAKKYSRTFLAYCSHPEKKEYAETETTCMSIGYTAGVGCEACGEWFSGHEIKTEIHHRDENGDGVCDDCENKVTGITRSGKCGETAYFIYYNDQSVIIDGRGAVNSYTFRNSEDIKKLTVNEGITSINEYAFVADIYDLKLPDSLVSIGDNAFSFTYIQSLELPDNLVYLGKGALGGSTIESLYIGKSLETIGGSLSSYYDLKEITVSEDNRYYISDENGVLFNKEQSVLICYPRGKTDKEYTIPETVRYIGDYAFKGSHIEKAVLPEGLEEIGAHAFDYCQYMTQINLPQSLKLISDSAFYMCRSISSIELPESLSVLGANSFAYVGSLVKGGIGSLRIPGGIKSIGDYAFMQCAGIDTLTLEEGIKEIGKNAFYGIDASRIEIPSSVVSIGEMA
ncbi:MAG: leucine-rich repeat protein, partial [Acutalibacteraceae bacterium]